MKLKDMTLNQVAEICKKCVKNEIVGCPFSFTMLIKCLGYLPDFSEFVEDGFNREVEIEEK